MSLLDKLNGLNFSLSEGITKEDRQRFTKAIDESINERKAVMYSEIVDAICSIRGISNNYQRTKMTQRYLSSPDATSLIKCFGIKSISVSNAAKDLVKKGYLDIANSGGDYKIRLTNLKKGAINPGVCYLFYKSEDDLRAYLLARLKVLPSTVNIGFSKNALENKNF